MAKNKKESIIKTKIASLIQKLKRNKGLTFAVLISFCVLSVLIYINSFENSGVSKLNINEIEIGMVASSDIISNRTIEYVDEKATKIRKITAKNSVLPVFYRDSAVSSGILKTYSEFLNFLIEAKTNAKAFSAFKSAVLDQYPTIINEKNLERLYNSPDFYEITTVATSILRQIVDTGLIEFPAKGIEDLNETELTIVTKQFDKQSYENVSVKKPVLIENLSAAVNTILVSIKKSEFNIYVVSLLEPFVKPNIIFAPEETEMRINEALKQVQPVKVTIAKGQRIIKRGFAITDEAVEQLKIYAEDGEHIDFIQLAGAIIFLAFSLITSLFLFSKKVIGNSLDFEFNLLILILFDIIYVLLLFTSKLGISSYPLNISAVLPVAFFGMLIAALISQKIAALTVIVLTLAVFGASGYKIQPALFALFSGLAGTGLINITGKRMDLIKTSCILTFVQPVIISALMIIFPGSASDKTFLVLETGLNGFISGILVLGFLPILETLLNTPTSFRLIELSDLNSPIMKKMLLTVAGTYNHSMMVANLAESACREIGANPLLARVGGYYHDIGKMDQGEYFAENQSTYNKHLDLNPRLSATILRSHVKLGVEKARQLHFPQAVIDIIAEHHGNSLITYFYAKAKEADPNVNPEDFSYPGTPPRSKESAVVMLADTVEAACRSLDNYSATRLKKFIDELISNKIKMGMLDNSNLTFSEIKIIKESFLNILIGYYHSRMKYPNQKDGDDDEAEDSNKKMSQKTEVEIIGQVSKGNNNV
ncbi:HD family phosphohydrolase [Treponema pedis]|uniref:HD domain-containing protein n=1 Tax=Treponema pedis str. T A4 TaxID=1291379 RepID=S6A8R8_9SPIR|nr:HDIG domain-containing metalloprotein [Treponema pedis]AGT44304.1 hypothetical protein TPE_1830 [Treponema pedis str. T A4]